MKIKKTCISQNFLIYHKQCTRKQQFEDVLQAQACIQLTWNKFELFTILKGAFDDALTEVIRFLVEFVCGIAGDTEF